MTIREETIRIAVDAGNISGTMVMPSARMPAVLFVHGWGGSQEQYLARAREVAALGCICLTFDLRGHAGRSGEHEVVSRESNMHDVLAAYDTLARHPFVDPAEIAVVGSSYGGYLAAILTARRPVKWLALRVPALYMDSGWELPKRQLHKEQDLKSYRESLVPAESNLALRACSQFAGDVLVIESELDHIIPHTVIASYLGAFIQPRSLTYRLIAGADHGLGDEASQNAYTTLLVNWLSEMVLGERGGNHATAAASKSPIPEAPPRPG